MKEFINFIVSPLAILLLTIFNMLYIYYYHDITHPYSLELLCINNGVYVFLLYVIFGNK